MSCPVGAHDQCAVVFKERAGVDAVAAYNCPTALGMALSCGAPYKRHGTALRGWATCQTRPAPRAPGSTASRARRRRRRAPSSTQPPSRGRLRRVHARQFVYVCGERVLTGVRQGIWWCRRKVQGWAAREQTYVWGRMRCHALVPGTCIDIGLDSRQCNTPPTHHWRCPPTLRRGRWPGRWSAAPAPRRPPPTCPCAPIMCAFECAFVCQRESVLLCGRGADARGDLGRCRHTQGAGTALAGVFRFQHTQHPAALP